MIRFALLYFIMLIIFVALLAGPSVAGKYVPKLTIPLDLLQPTGQNNNDTSTSVTGSALNGLGAAATGGSKSTKGS